MEEQEWWECSENEYRLDGPNSRLLCHNKWSKVKSIQAADSQPYSCTICFYNYLWLITEKMKGHWFLLKYIKIYYKICPSPVAHVTTMICSLIPRLNFDSTCSYWSNYYFHGILMPSNAVNSSIPLLPHEQTVLKLTWPALSWPFRSGSCTVQNQSCTSWLSLITQQHFVYLNFYNLLLSFKMLSFTIFFVPCFVYFVIDG